MKSKGLKLFVIVSSFVVFFFACVTSIISINYYNSRIQCLYSGKFYNSGSKFSSVDGCNTCSCNNGVVSCTEMACDSSFSKLQRDVQVTCKELSKGEYVYSISPGEENLNRLKETLATNSGISTPVIGFMNKNERDAEEILTRYFSYSPVEARGILMECQ